MALTPKYPKHFLQIRDKLYDIGNNFSISCDKSSAYRTLSFKIPFTNTVGLDTTGLQKYDVVKLYFKYYSSPSARDLATINDMQLIFNGYIDDPTSTEQPEDLSWDIKCKAIGGLLYEETTLTKFYEINLRTLLQKATEELQIPGLTFEADYTQIKDNFILQVENSTNFGKVLDSIREKYAINVFGKADGTISFVFPSYFTSSQTVLEYDLALNIRNLEGGSKANQYDCVVVVGTNSLGIAFDPVTYCLKNSISIDTYENVVPDESKLSVLTLYRRDLISDQDCQELAKNQLYDMAKNYSISFATDFDPTLELGALLKIANSKQVKNTQLFIISKLEHSITGEDLTTTVTAYSNASNDFPKDILLSKTGLFDVDTLQISTPKNILSGSLK